MRRSDLQIAYVIDEYGEVAMGACDYLHSHAFDAARSLVNNLGYIAYLVADQHIQIKFRPSLTSLMSYSRLMRWLDCEYPQRVLVSYLSGDEWHYEFAGSARGAARCVDRIMQQYGGGPLGNVCRELLPLHSNGIPPAFRQAIDYWQSYRTAFDPHTAVPALRTILDDRFVLSTELQSGMFALGAFGANRDDSCRRWLSSASGVSVRSAPDPAYGASCANAYMETTRCGEPVMDNVDALVSWFGARRVRYRYTRLMLPFSSPTGRWLLSCHVPAPRLRLLV